MAAKLPKQRDPVYLDQMEWVPGQGSDSSLLRDLAGRFGKPARPLGESWFLSETRFLHDKLNAHGLEPLTDSEITAALEDVISGLWCFPEMIEWSEWFGYFLPRILSSPRFLSNGWHGSLCTGILALSVREPEQPAARFEADFAQVLSPWIMQSYFWNGGKYQPLQGAKVWKDSWGIYGIEGEVSTSLLFTWRYLHPKAIQPWLRTVLAIEDVNWRAHFMIWLADVSPLFEHGKATYPVLLQCNMDNLWPDFYRVMVYLKHGSPIPDWTLISEVNIEAFRIVIREEFNQATYFSWIDQLSSDADLWPQMETRLEQMQDFFFK